MLKWTIIAALTLGASATAYKFSSVPGCGDCAGCGDNCAACCGDDCAACCGGKAAAKAPRCGDCCGGDCKSCCGESCGSCEGCAKGGTCDKGAPDAKPVSTEAKAEGCCASHG